jgi:DNA polymerase-3 subunit beta
MLEAEMNLLHLRDAVKLAKKVTGGKTSMPMLQAVKLFSLEDSGVVVEATNLDEVVQRVVPAEVRTRGATVILADSLDRALGAVLDSRVRIANGDRPGHATVFAGDVRAQLLALHEDDWPSGMRTPQGFVDVDPAALRAMLARTTYALSEDETRMNLRCVCFEADGTGVARMTATDGHRLAHVRWDDGFAGLDGKVLVPGRLANLVEAVLSSTKKQATTCSFAVDGEGDSEAVLFRIGLTMLQGRACSLEYPDYKQVIPKFAQHAVEIDRLAALRVLKPLARACPDKRHPLRFDIGRDEIGVVLSDPDRGMTTATIACKALTTASPGISIAFNAHYLVEALSAFECEHVWFETTDNLSPAKIHHGDEDGHVQVLMPMRL